MYQESREVGKYNRKAQVFAIGSLDQIIDKEKAKELLYAETKRYNAGLKNKSVARAISIDEEKLYPQLAEQVGVSPNDPNWVNASKDYWASFLDRIPFGVITEAGIIDGGKEIDASYLVKENEVTKQKEIYADNFNEYLLFNLMQKDSSVSTDPLEYSNKGQYSFFCVDSEVEEKRSKELVDVKTEAHIELTKLLQEDNIELLKTIVAATDNTVTATYAQRMSLEEAKRSLFETVHKNPKIFLDIAKNKKGLKGQVAIRRYVESGAITKVGMTHYFEGDILGNEEEAIKFIKDPTNASMVSRMNAKLDEFIVFDTVVS